MHEKKGTTVDIGQKVSEKRAGEQYGTKKKHHYWMRLLIIQQTDRYILRFQGIDTKRESVPAGDSGQEMASSGLI